MTRQLLSLFAACTVSAVLSAEELADLRAQARGMTSHAFLWLLYSRTGLTAIAAADEDGSDRAADEEGRDGRVGGSLHEEIVLEHERHIEEVKQKANASEAKILAMRDQKC